MKWGKARKKPVEVQFREPNRKVEVIHTLEGVVTATRGIHYVIRGTHGERYPIRKDIFEETFEVIEEPKE